MAQLHCDTCTQPFTARTRQAKYCAPCRLFQNLRALLNTTRDCKICSRRYAPILPEDYCCSACDPGAQRDARPTPPCRICGVARKLFRDGEVVVCYVCLHDPNQRPTIIRGLAQGIRDRQEGRHE